MNRHSPSLAGRHFKTGSFSLRAIQMHNPTLALPSDISTWNCPATFERVWSGDHTTGACRGVACRGFTLKHKFAIKQSFTAETLHPLLHARTQRAGETKKPYFYLIQS